jgi:hypothetical protein
VPIAAVDGARIVEGVVGALLVLAALVIAGIGAVRWRRQRRAAAAEDPGVRALARFVDVTLNDPTSFGGGATAARVRRRRDTVTYGYLAVAEEYVGTDGQTWCTLTVTLPGRVPFLVADNRAAEGRPHVPMAAPHQGRVDEPSFDSVYLVGAEEPWVIARILGPAAVQKVLLDNPIQRLMLRESSVMLRTFDGVRLDEAMIAALGGQAERFLSTAPAFVTSSRAAAGNPTPPEAGQLPLPPGFYGPDPD